MWREIEQNESQVVEVNSHRVVTYSFGTGDDVILCLNGGAGAAV